MTVIGDAGGFHLLPAGTPRVDPSRLLQGERLGKLLAQARESFDMIIVDAPPVLPVPDALIIGRWTDGACWPSGTTPAGSRWWSGPSAAGHRRRAGPRRRRQRRQERLHLRQLRVLLGPGRPGRAGLSRAEPSRAAARPRAAATVT